MNERNLRRTKMASQRKEIRQPKPLPAPNSDFYDVRSTLAAEEQEILKQVRHHPPIDIGPWPHPAPGFRTEAL